MAQTSASPDCTAVSEARWPPVSTAREKKRPCSASGAKTSFSASMPDIESGVFTAATLPRNASSGRCSRANTMLR